MHIAQVNQRYWLQLRRGIELQGRHYAFDMCLVPQYLPKEESLEEMGALEHLIYAAYRDQGKCVDEPPNPSRWPGILFRFQWPPNFTQPLPGYKYIHQQACLHPVAAVWSWNKCQRLMGSKSMHLSSGSSAVLPPPCLDLRSACACTCGSKRGNKSARAP